MVDVPFADVAAEWAPLRAAVTARIEQVLARGQFILGPEVDELETALGQRARTRHAITCSSGTMALQLALLAIDVGPGDEVIVPAFTFAAPLEAVLLLGARPVLADVDPCTYTIDPESVREQMTDRTRAVIGVSLFGQPADYAALRALATGPEVVVIDDAAQSFGSTLDGQPAGSLADITCTSFFPTKPFGGIGDGGAVLCADADVAARIRAIRDHGQTSKYVHTLLGTNGRLDTISCAALLEALPALDAKVARRNALAQRYALGLEPAAAQGKLTLPALAPGVVSTWAQYAIQLGQRSTVRDRLAQAGVTTAVHYPSPLHHQPAFRDRVTAGRLAVSESLAEGLLCLPLFPTLTDAQLDYVVDGLLVALP